MLRSVLGTASWRAQQMSPQFAADVSLLLGATAQPVVQDLLDANKLVRDMRRSAAQALHVHSFCKCLSLVCGLESLCGAFGQPTAFPCGNRCTEGIGQDPPMCLDAQGGIKANLCGLGRCRRDVLS